MSAAKNMPASSGRRYGLVSMLAMIVGVVIGSGIFVKNDQISGAGASPFESMMAWIIVSVIVVFMLISFLEISSITMKKKESGSLANWSRHLWGEGLSKFIGVFFPMIYFPILLAGLSVFSSDYMLEAIQEPLGQAINIGVGVEWTNFILVSLLGMGTIGLIGAMNALTNKPGKVFQSAGTVIKLIPLFGIVLIGFVVISGGITTEGLSLGDIFNPNSPVNKEAMGLSDKNMATMILMILPAVMFSFDGFLFAASLSNEAKSPSTFKVAAISGVSFITVIYILVTLFTYVTGGDGSSVNEAIKEAFGGAEWVSPLVLYIIFISMITSISGNIISSNRMMADLSAEKIVVDKNGILTKRTESGSLYISGSIIILLALGWFVLLRALDGFDIMAQLNAGLILEPDSSFRLFGISGWSTDFIIIGSYSIYTILMIGGVKNRFTNNVDVDKNKGFLPATFIAVPAMMVIVGYFAYDILSFGLGFSGADMMQTIGTLTVLVMSILLVSTALLIFSKNRKKATFTNKEIWYKKVYDYSYRNLLTSSETIEMYGDTIPKSDRKTYSFSDMEEMLKNPSTFFKKEKKPSTTKKASAKKTVSKKTSTKKTVSKKTPTKKK